MVDDRKAEATLPPWAPVAPRTAIMGAMEVSDLFGCHGDGDSRARSDG